jgi:uncharacterized protein YecE (DUF72 family)
MPELAPVDPVHDPGPVAARARAAAVPIPDATIIQPAGAGEIRVGTAGWTDPTLTAAGIFYPAGADTPEARLRYYASRFPVVEIDSPYYALPTRRAAELWAERTPPDFTFDVKAYALMTGHPSETRRLPKEIRDALPADVRERERIYPKDLPPELFDAVWTTFTDALAPLHASGKLGAVLLQYPRWFVPGRESADAILDARRRLGDLPAAVEFRNHRWLTGRIGERTLEFLREHGLAYVMVDEPQGEDSSVPPVVATTSPRLAVLRMHGRRADVWERKGVTVAERYRYLYDREQLAGWVPGVLEAARRAREVHVIQNNCHANYGTTNALEFTQLLLDAVEAAD